MSSIINRYFPNLSEHQKSQFEALEGLYKEWNEKINVISRKDIENLYTHHILHSLAIAKFIQFTHQTSIIDLGTGGGFPGIPLAIIFPHCQFTLIDSTTKKISVVQAICQETGLLNAKPKVIRAEEEKEKYDFVVTRAVAKIDMLMLWSKKLIHHKQKNAYPNGLIALKGNIEEERKLLPRHEYAEIIPIQKYFEEPYFENKCIWYVQI